MKTTADKTSKAPATTTAPVNFHRQKPDGEPSRRALAALKAAEEDWAAGRTYTLDEAMAPHREGKRRRAST